MTGGVLRCDGKEITVIGCGLVGGLAASVGWIGIAKLRLKIIRNSRPASVNMLRLGLTFMAILLL